MPPYISPFEFDGPANAGDTVQLTCHVLKGDKPLHIAWHFHGEALSTHMGISTMMIGHRANFLSISSVAAGHRGIYTCLARNDAGVANYSAELKVFGTVNNRMHYFALRCAFLFKKNPPLHR